MPLEPPGPACSGLGVLSRFCDLFGIDEGSKQLVTLYGRKDRTFDIYYSPVSISGTLGSQSECCAATLAMADFNDGGRSTTSPVLVEAAGNISGTLARMELWVDGVKKYPETTSLWFNTSVYVGPGDHHFDVFAVNTAGTKWLQSVYATTP